MIYRQKVEKGREMKRVKRMVEREGEERKKDNGGRIKFIKACFGSTVAISAVFYPNWATLKTVKMYWSRVAGFWASSKPHCGRHISAPWWHALGEGEIAWMGKVWRL